MDGIIEGLDIVDGEFVCKNQRVMAIINKIKSTTGIVSKMKRDNFENRIKLHNKKRYYF